jgi:FKBP-type peptidyl-prolyl cis-trans isomerase
LTEWAYAAAVAVAVVARIQFAAGRQLVIPPGLAYGDCGAGHAIATGERLIFVCGLVSV